MGCSFSLRRGFDTLRIAHPASVISGNQQYSRFVQPLRARQRPCAIVSPSRTGWVLVAKSGARCWEENEPNANQQRPCILEEVQQSTERIHTAEKSHRWVGELVASVKRSKMQVRGQLRCLGSPLHIKLGSPGAVKSRSVDRMGAAQWVLGSFWGIDSGSQWMMT